MKWLLGILAALTTFFAFQSQRLKNKLLQEKVDDHEAESEALSRMSEAKIAQERQSNEIIEKAKNTDFSIDDLDRIGMRDDD